MLTVVGGIAIRLDIALFSFHPRLLVSMLLLPVIVGVAWLGFSSYVRFKMRTAPGRFRDAARAGHAAHGRRSARRAWHAPSALDRHRRVARSRTVRVSARHRPDEHRREHSSTRWTTSRERMPSHESLMLARVFRVQSETGGDLARILDQLADTIKDRRQVQRKISALTAEGRMSAWVLMLIPVGLGLFIVTTQPAMGARAHVHDDRAHRFAGRPRARGRRLPRFSRAC